MVEGAPEPALPQVGERQAGEEEEMRGTRKAPLPCHCPTLGVPDALAHALPCASVSLQCQAGGGGALLLAAAAVGGACVTLVGALSSSLAPQLLLLPPWKECCLHLPHRQQLLCIQAPPAVPRQPPRFRSGRAGAAAHPGIRGT